MSSSHSDDPLLPLWTEAVLLVLAVFAFAATVTSMILSLAMRYYSVEDYRAWDTLNSIGGFWEGHLGGVAIIFASAALLFQLRDTRRQRFEAADAARQERDRTEREIASLKMLQYNLLAEKLAQRGDALRVLFLELPTTEMECTQGISALEQAWPRWNAKCVDGDFDVEIYADIEACERCARVAEEAAELLSSIPGLGISRAVIVDQGIVKTLDGILDLLRSRKIEFVQWSHLLACTPQVKAAMVKGYDKGFRFNNIEMVDQVIATARDLQASQAKKELVHAESFHAENINDAFEGLLRSLRLL